MPGKFINFKEAGKGRKLEDRGAFLQKQELLLEQIKFRWCKV
jgi:hypothetical protein